MSEIPKKNIKAIEKKIPQDNNPEESEIANAQKPVDDIKEAGKKRITASLDVAAIPDLINPETKHAQAEVTDYDHLRYDLAFTGDIGYFGALEKIVRGEEVDFSKLSNNSKKLVLLNFGRWGSEGYDMLRAKSGFDGETITEEQFYEVMRKRGAVSDITEQTKTNKLARSMAEGIDFGELYEQKDTPEDDEMIDQMADFFGVDPEEIREIWMDSKDYDDFRGKLNKEYLKIGVCRDIAVMQAKLASDMGYKNTFTQPSSWAGEPHLISGFRDENGNIVILNYYMMITTDTPNMKMALKYVENNQKGILMQYLISKGEDKGTKLIPIKSEASETLGDMARGTPDEADERMEDILDKGVIEYTGTGIDFSIERNRTNLELSLENMASSTMLSTTYYNLQDREANAINKAFSARAGHEIGNEVIQVGAGVAYANIELKAKDFDQSRAKLNEIFLNAYIKAHKNIEITDHLKYQIGAIVDAVSDFGLEKRKFVSGELDLATGQRLSYINSDLELYVGLISQHTFLPDDVQVASLDPTTYDMIHELLAAHVGADVGLGTYLGHKVNFHGQAQVGTKYSGLATEYKGKARLSAEEEEGKGGAYVEGSTKYTDSHDFRVAEEMEAEASAGYRTEVKGGIMEISGFTFHDKSLGKFKDPRLDDFGFGFKLKYEF